MALYFMTMPGFGEMALDISTTPDVRAGAPQLLFRTIGVGGGPGQLSNIATPDGGRCVFLPQVPAATAGR